MLKCYVEALGAPRSQAGFRGPLEGYVEGSDALEIWGRPLGCKVLGWGLRILRLNAKDILV